MLNKLSTLVLVVTALALAGCATPKFPQYAAAPAEMIGFGVDQSWMWLDADKLGDSLVKAKVNTTSIGLFSCNQDKTPTQTLPWGYWMDHFDEMTPYLDKFLNAMQKRRITVYVTLVGWNQRNGNLDPATGKGATIGCARYNSAWFSHIVDYFVKRGTDGLVLCTAAEPVPNYGPGGAYMAKFNDFTAILNQKWSGAKGWNYNVRPTTAPAGYWIETHPQRSTDKFTPGSIILTDGPAASEFGNSNPANPVVENGPALQAWIQKLHAAGDGFIWWGMSFDGNSVDYNGIKTIGSAVQ